ncbi:hypothetical protein Baya_3246 [Bagarius yarrelli]|uniref:Uncharacterized protein n=1 Tax=Bagarius yarrelli TaxID=175774 RepID=A0A556TS57_BAGYA|nr:hypothetical protein Baya_3246 [Bagarius yarrelli]
MNRAAESQGQKQEKQIQQYSLEFFNLDECDDGVGEDSNSGQYGGDRKSLCSLANTIEEQCMLQSRALRKVGVRKSP